MRPLGQLTAGARSACAPRPGEGVRPPPGHDHEGGPPAPPASREEWLRLVEGIAPRLGLGDKALRALRVIVTACRWTDFADGGAPPVCFRQQQRLAEAIGVTPGHFRKLEARLEAAGLIERRTCENGHRGRLAPGPGAPVAGLSLAPLLAGLPRWRAIERAMAAEVHGARRGPGAHPHRAARGAARRGRAAGGPSPSRAPRRPARRGLPPLQALRLCRRDRGASGRVARVDRGRAAGRSPAGRRAHLDRPE